VKSPSRADAPGLPRPAAILSIAFILYGAVTLVSLLYGGVSGGLRSPLLAALALPCGAFALAGGLLLRARSARARLALIGWALSLFALNAARITSEGPLTGMALVLVLSLGAGVLGAVAYALHRYIGRVCAPSGSEDAPLVASSGTRRAS